MKGGPGRKKLRCHFFSCRIVPARFVLKDQFRQMIGMMTVVSRLMRSRATQIPRSIIPAPVVGERDDRCHHARPIS
ncbi:MAG: hypothetical protein WC367_04780 [Methanoregula sp.]